MKRHFLMNSKRFAAVLLAGTFLMTGCQQEEAVTSSQIADMEWATEVKGNASTEVTDYTDITASPREIPEWARSSGIYEVNIRQYTEEGTFEAFAKHLDEIKDMGIDILWFMPIHPISETNRSGVLGSYYSITDYKAVNPEFGTAEDFKALVDLAHEKGFHVMMDWVANHTGWDCQWIKDHPEWYTQDASGNVISPANMGWPDVADLNYDNEDMRQEMIACMKYWISEFDIDGFRCDYASGVPKDFWDQAREALEEEKHVYMLAEDGNTTSLLEKAFDFNYNWSLYDAMVEVAHDSKSPSKLKLYIPDNYPEGTYTLNFIDNHDKNSYEGTIVENFGNYAIPAFFTYIYTIPGVPLVYTGDEIGLDHAIAFMEKDTIDWTNQSADYRPLIKILGQLRKENVALSCGAYGGEIQYLDIDNSYVVAYERALDDNKVTVLINMSKRELTVDTTAVSLDSNATIAVHGAADQIMYEADDKDVVDLISEELTLSPWEFYVITQ